MDFTKHKQHTNMLAHCAFFFRSPCSFDAVHCTLRIHNVRTHIMWFEVHLIKFYMIISSHFDDHQLRLEMCRLHLDCLATVSTIRRCCFCFSCFCCWCYCCVFFLLAFVGKTSYSYSRVAFHNFGLCVCVRPQHTYYYIALRESRPFSAAI